MTGTWGILVESAIVAPLHYADALRSPGAALRLLLSTLVQYHLPLVIGFLGGIILTARHRTTEAGSRRFFCTRASPRSRAR
jgi:mannitol-specific phosphotransferase system IIBC component